VAERQAARPDQRAFAAARRDRMAHDCWATTRTGSPGPCAFGDVRAPVTLALLGDSHAEHWLGGLDQAGRTGGWKVIAMVKGGCPVSAAPELERGRRARWARACAEYREAMVRRIVAMRPAAAVLSSWDHYVGADGRADRDHISAEAWGRGLRRTYARLAAAGIPVVVLRAARRAPASTCRRACRAARRGCRSPGRARTNVPAPSSRPRSRRRRRPRAGCRWASST
jgi:hypothetical protein